MRIIFLLLIFISWTAQATSLVNRFQFLSTSVLPNEIWTFGVSRGQSLGVGSGGFSADGQKISNQQFFSKDVTYSNLLDEIKDPLEHDLAKAAFNVYSRDKNSVAGKVVNDVDVSQSSNAYILGRGFGEKSSLFFIFPVVTIKTKFNSHFEHGESLLKLASELKAEGQYRQAQEIIEKSENALRKRLDENGYNPSYPSELTTLANVHVNYRYQAISRDHFQLTTDSFLVVPAGKKYNVDEFLYFKINEEQYSFKQNATVQFIPLDSFSILSSAYYHKRFGFKQSRRIPKNSTSPLSDDIDPNTNLKFGDSFGASAQINYSPTSSFVFYLGQSLELKEKDKVSGLLLESSRYDYLEQNSDQSLGITYAGVSINTIKSFLSKNFPAPLDLNFQYSVSNYGKNTMNNQSLTMNLMVFYK
jgi:hypothetical protein